MRLRLIAALALTACALTACTTSTPEPDPTVTVTSQPDPVEQPTLTDDMTELVVDLSWEQQTKDDKDAMCLGIAVGGPEWAAEQMQQGAGDSSVDWNRAAELVEQKCAER
ncbi:hypothetical protein [Streptomyces canus]|uniref:hypothetical protein n=1 Tax=Streptomyces canus TaxID=58343 RepID=UPI00038018AF|nr:hypothetical protein [Streptomyces canus]